MATAVAIAIRKQGAIERIGRALDIDTYVQGRDADMTDVILMERIADAVEEKAKAPELREVVAQASIEELSELPGVGEATAKRLKKAAKEGDK
jgi:DNA uptake protein ComE-like DNA-binding protein